MSLANNSLDVSIISSPPQLRRLYMYETIIASGMGTAEELKNIKNEGLEKLYWRLKIGGFIEQTIDTSTVYTKTQADVLYADKLDAAARGAANGVASLNSLGLVPDNQVRIMTGYGLYVDRPAAATVPTGYVYNASDVREQYYRTSGAAWVVTGSGGNRLGKAEVYNLPMVTNSTTAGIDIHNSLTMNVLAGERPFEIEWQGNFAVSVDTGAMYVDILIDGAIAKTNKLRASGADIWDTRGGIYSMDTPVANRAYVVTMKFRAETAGQSARVGDNWLLIARNV